MAVAVILARAAAIVLDVRIFLGHHQLHAVAEHVRLLLGARVGGELLVYYELAVGAQRVGHIELGGHARHIVGGAYLPGVSHSLVLKVLERHLRVFPRGKLVLKACSVVVVRRCPPEFGLKRIALAECRHAVDVEIVYPARSLVEGDGGGTGLHREAGQHLVLLDLLVGGLGFLVARSLGHGHYLLEGGELVGAELQLLACHGVARVEQRLYGLELVVHVEHHLTSVGGLLGIAVAAEADDTALLRIHVERLDCALLEHLALAYQFPVEAHIAQVLEEILVVHLHFALLKVDGSGPDALHEVAVLVGLRIGLAVGAYETVAVEVVVGSRVAAVVTAVGKDLPSLLIVVTKSLVYEVPDIPALIVGVFADKVPVFLEKSAAVTHCVSVLTLYEWARIILLAVFLAVFVGVVHGAEYVALAVLPDGALVVNGA